MIITYLRSSSYGCHDMCEMKWFIEYVLGWSGPSGKKQEKGTIVHKILEILGNIKKAHQDSKEYFVDDVVGRVYIHTYNLDRIIEKSYNYYVEQSENNWTEKDFSEVKKWVNKALSFRKGEMDPRNKNILGVEVGFDIEFLEPWAVYNYEYNGEKIEGFLAIKGTMDQLNYIDDNTIEITDWKTGKRLNWATSEVYTQEKLKKNHQLRMYHYAVKRMYPEIDNVLVTIYYINDGGPFSVCFTDKDLDITKKMIKDKFEAIKNADVPKLTKSWKCTKFCHAGMSTFENTDVPTLIEKRDGQVTPKGQPMTKCETIKYLFQHRDENSIIKNCSAPNHEIDHYEKPG